jgi:hypothetical protein
MSLWLAGAISRNRERVPAARSTVIKLVVTCQPFSASSASHACRCCASFCSASVRARWNKSRGSGPLLVALKR